MSKVGIFAGSFDPIHKGHIDLALTSLKQAKLNKVYFLAEAKPRSKPGVTHLAHRVAMIRQALKPHPGLELLELPDKQFLVAKTLPRLRHKFKKDELFVIVGSDVLGHISEWPLIETLFRYAGLIVGFKNSTSKTQIKKMINNLTVKPLSVFIIDNTNSSLSSRKIRQAIRTNQKPAGITASTHDYIKKHWLYVLAPPPRKGN